MSTATRLFGVAGALALGAGLSSAQNSNDSPFNNGGEVVIIYSDPSVAGTNGDLYWRTHRGANFINDCDGGLGGSLMEVDGYLESLFDTDWSTTPQFYDRAHTFSFNGDVPDYSVLGVLVQLGPSGFGAPCTVAPSICSPATAGSVCAPPGTVVGWLVDITFGATVGSGVVITAAGAAADDMATTWFVTGGMTASGGTCGAGDYGLQDVQSTDETQADIAGGINPSSGSQLAGAGLINDPVTSMHEGHETWRGNIINVRANTLGGGVEIGDNGGGAMNGRNLSVGGGGSTIGVELRDFGGIGALGIVGASLTPLPNPGLPLLGGCLLVLPDGVFTTTSALWQGPINPIEYVAPGTPGFADEGAFNSIQLPVPPTVVGVTLHIQGARVTFGPSGVAVNSTNKVTTILAP